MQIIDLLTPSRVIVDVRTSSKKRLLEALAGLLNERGNPETERAIFESLVRRERLGSTGLAHGVAIPHGRSAAVDRAVGAFIRLAEPLEFDSLDRQRVDLVFGLVVPEHFTDQHLMFLAELAELFSDPAVTARLRSAPDSAAVYGILTGGRERNAA
jgi:PTS system nitrogen regulatory IIA component